MRDEKKVKKAGKKAKKAEFFRPEEEQIRSRYRNLYGEGEYEAVVEGYLKTQKRREILLLVLFLGIALYSLVQFFAPDTSLRYLEGSDYRVEAVSRPAEGQSGRQIEMEVYLATKEGIEKEEKSVYISPVREKTGEEVSVLGEESEEDIRARQLDQALRDSARDTSSGEVVLPTVLEDGTVLVWTRKKRPPLLLMGLFLAMALLYLFKGRYLGIEAEEREAKESVVRELPEFLHKVVLLMDAGVVLEVSLKRAMEEVRGDGYFARQMRRIHGESLATNLSYAEGFAAFAARSGVQELLRIAGIFSDARERGNDLSEKLREEGELLWVERKRQSEEKGRLAESKLTLPLAILLMVLVVVTVSPALFEM